MNFEEARAEAKFIWGNTGQAKLDFKIGNRKRPYKIGQRVYTIMDVQIFFPHGQGETWKSAVNRAKTYLDSKGIAYGPNLSAFSDHAYVNMPEDVLHPIRRYMTFDRFEYLVTTSSLWFSRVDQMEDKLEGSVSALNIEARTNQYYSQLKKFPIALGKNPSLEKYLNMVSFKRKEARKCMFANCWQMRMSEDSAMWERYIRSGLGLVIESDYSSLTQSFLSIHERPIVAGLVNYADYESDLINENSEYEIFLSKKNQLDHERELRALLWVPPYTEDGIDYDKHSNLFGIPISVDTRKLINKIVISPSAPSSFMEKVRGLTSTRGLPDPVVSSLSREPIF